MTFSIVAYEPSEGAWGIAVASKFLAVGSVVPHARAGAGAVATQSYAKVTFGADGLAAMANGQSARAALDAVLAADPQQAIRQVGFVDAQGGSAAHTGAECYDWAGHRLGEGFTCQGNILAGSGVIAAMAETFVSAKGDLADRLLAALIAGDAAGGDRRGRQSAALLVVKANAGYGGDNDRYLDLRDDDSAAPISKLQTMLTSHRVFFQAPDPTNALPIIGEVARELQAMLNKGGYMQREPDGLWDSATQQAFLRLVGNENLEERWSPSPDKLPDQINRKVLEYLRGRFGA